MARTRKHVLLVPYPAYGHISPLLELGKLLSFHHDVTMAVSKYMVDYIRHALSGAELEANAPFQFVGLLDGLTPKDEEGMDAPKFMVTFGKSESVLKNLYRNMPTKNEPTRALTMENLSGSLTGPVHVVISDIVMADSTRICHERGIPYHIFHPSPGIILRKFVEVEQETAILPDEYFFECWDYGSGDGVLESFKDNTMAFLGSFKHAESVLVNSIAEFEPQTTDKICKSHWTAGKPIRFVAPLFPMVSKETSAHVVDEKRVEDWLNGQQNRSVIYVSFGSMAVTCQKQVEEIAKALLSINKPFIWTLATRDQVWLPEEITSNIENQFENGCRFLILTWVPQNLILRHRATRLFVSHCGWNSTIETIVAGVPVVCWPMFGDQHWNAALLVKEGMGIKLPNTSMKCSRIVSAPEICRAVTAVGGWGSCREESSGKLFTKKAKEARATVEKALAEGGSSRTAVDELIADIERY